MSAISPTRTVAALSSGSDHFTNIKNALTARVCRESYWTFVQEFWETIPGAGEMTPNWHMEFLANELETLARRVFKGEHAQYDLIINVPPGSSKSSICSILFHPWVWINMPGARFINASHTESLVLDLANKARSVIKSEKYQTCFPEIKLDPETQAKGAYANTFGGMRYASTVGGQSPTGRHGHFLVEDDLIDPQKAVSEAERNVAKEFVSNYMPTRMVDKSVSVIILIMQRVAIGDPTDVMLDIGSREGSRPVRQICIPAELTDKVNPPELAEKYVDGLMDPNRLPKHVLMGFKARGSLMYGSQFLQDPKQAGGGLFKIHFFNNRKRASPYKAKRVRFWDRASSESELACATAGTLICRDEENNYYIEDVVRGFWEPTERNKMLRATALKDRTRYGPHHEPIIAVEWEGGSSGRDAWKGLMKVMAGFHCVEVRVTGSKDKRAEPVADQFDAGNVYLVDGGESEGTGKATWDINYFIEELLAFRPDPTVKKLGRKKDIVDSLSGGFNYLLSMRTIGLKTYPIRANKKKGAQVIVTKREHLETLIVEDKRSLLIDIHEPLFDATHVQEIPTLPTQGLTQLLSTLLIRFANIDTKDHQATWLVPVEPYNKKVEDLIFSRDNCKTLWAFITRRRDFHAECFIFCDNGDGRALSLAYALSDVLRLSREDMIFHEGYESKENSYIYDLFKSTKHLVIA